MRNSKLQKYLLSVLEASETLTTIGSLEKYITKRTRRYLGYLIRKHAGQMFIFQVRPSVIGAWDDYLAVGVVHPSAKTLGSEYQIPTNQLFVQKEPGKYSIESPIFIEEDPQAGLHLQNEPQSPDEPQWSLRDIGFSLFFDNWVGNNPVHVRVVSAAEMNSHITMIWGKTDCVKFLQQRFGATPQELVPIISKASH